VQDYLSLTNHVYTPAYILVNEDWWQDLSDARRALYSEAARAAATAQRARIAAATDEIIAEAVAEGIAVNEADTDAFAEVTKPVWQSFRDEHGDALIEAVDSVR